jgi:hypothetical protein
MDFLSKLEPGKTYKFESKSGQMNQTVLVTTVDGETINGYLIADSGHEKSNFSDSFENIMRNVSKISAKEVNLHKTAGAIIASVFATVIVVAVVWISLTINL